MRNQPFSDLTDDWSANSPSGDHPRRRPIILALIIVLCQLPIAARIVHVQAVVGESFVAPWRIAREEIEVVPARDGRIVSRDGVVLAQDEVQYDISVDFRWLESPSDPVWLRRQAIRELTSKEKKDPARRDAAESNLRAHREELLHSLASISGVSELQISSRMEAIQRKVEVMLAAVEKRRQESLDAANSDFDWSQGLAGIAQLVKEELTRSPSLYKNDPIVLKEELQDHVVLKNVPLQVVAAVQSQPARFLGAHIRSSSTRSYPQGDLAAHLIGVRRHVANDDSEDRGRKGETGIERSADDRLRGVAGETQKTLNRHEDLLSSNVIRPPQDGRDVVLTVDCQLQKVAEALLDAAVMPPPRSLSAGFTIPRGACLIAMDVWTGDILTIASSPRPSLAVLARPTAEEWERLKNDPAQPLFSRAIQMALPPGSLFKIVTASAALESGALARGEILHCQGYLEQPDRYRCLLFRQQGIGHGQLQLEDALSQSCHVCFHELARRVGPESLLDWAGRFGLGRPTGIDLPAEVKGRLPQLAVSVNGSNGSQKVSGETLQLGVGQGAVLVSPLQALRMVAAVANGGYLVTPHTMTPERSGDQSPVNDRVLQQVPGLSAETVASLRQGLEMSVHDPRGDATSAHVQMLRMAAITGTGNGGDKPDHAWICGYAPANQPRVAVVVVLEHGGEGLNAAPIFHDFVTELLGFGELRPAPSAAPQ